MTDVFNILANALKPTNMEDQKTFTHRCYDCNTAGQVRKETGGWETCPTCNGTTIVTEPVTHVLSQDGTEIYRGSENECYFKLQRYQSHSADWAMKYEGYKIEPC